MIAELRDEWIRRLRSGRYVQGRQWLCKDGKHCCWGILCEMAAEAGAVERVAEGDRIIFGEKGPVFSGMAIPDPKVLAWCGLEAMNPYPCQPSLIHMNDVLKMSFPEIANFIDEHFEAALV